jgi:hypothetical protein|tara:strand:+ start:1406 stop:1630 length:225 start_codon:yes stop_codon:yes gene_type:complete
MTENENTTLTVNLSFEEAALLLKLLKTSKDDPRINGLIGTCFWFHNHTKPEEQSIKEAWTSICKKLEELKLGAT